jgi:nitrogenase-stabilizing/protective protein
MTTSSAAPGVLEQLNKASAAEDFFALLGVDYDPKVVSVVRLHILRRMGQHLVGAKDEFVGLSDEEITARCKTFLEQAYADFLEKSPLDERLFKVLKDAVKPAETKAPPLVTLTTLK